MHLIWNWEIKYILHKQFHIFTINEKCGKFQYVLYQL